MDLGWLLAIVFFPLNMRKMRCLDVLTLEKQPIYGVVLDA